MRLVHFPESHMDTTVKQLPKADLIVNLRPSRLGYKFEVTVNCTTLTITRNDPPEDHGRYHDGQTGWGFEISFCVYNTNEDQYSFNSTMYIFHGLEREYPPLDTTEVIIKDGVKVIGDCTFVECKSLVKVTIPDSVKRIEYCGFGGCESLRFIELPSNPECIGGQAFGGCTSLEALFLPLTLKMLHEEAFNECTSLKILNILDSIEYIGCNAIAGCKSLMTDEMAVVTPEEKIEWLRNHYNPLHNLCCQPSVTPQATTQHIQDNNNEEMAKSNDRPKFTALRILVANPSVTGEMITAYLQLTPNVAVMQDNIGQAPLHMLCSCPYFFNGSSTRDAIRTYLGFNQGKEAALMIDKKGKSPLDYLCEKDSDELAPFFGESFSDIRVWWYTCLDMNLLVE